MPYLTAIRTLAGHPNFQQFEHFILAVALKKFRCSVVEKTKDSDRLLDIVVRKPDGRCVAIEAKATDSRLEVGTAKNLQALVKEWKPGRLRERLDNHRRIHGSDVTAILATTATIDRDVWNAEKSHHGLDAFDLWDASQLASFAASDWAIASLLPGLPERIDKYRHHSVDALREAGSLRLGVSIDALIDEEARSTPSLALGSNTLIVGPPFIGKTCWALRRAWRTCCKLVPTQSSILWFNAIRDSEDGPENLSFFDTNLSAQEDYILVIDDVHTARANPSVWTSPVRKFAGRRLGRVRVVWVARDESIAEFLNVGCEQVCIEPFPIQEVVGLFLSRLTSAPLGHRVVAALEAGLDPAIGRAMEDWAWDLETTYSTVVERIRKQKERRVPEVLNDLKKRLNDSYLTYLGLLPFGSIAIGVEESFVAETTKTDTAGLARLEETGVVTRSQNGREMILTEHPFQLRKTLEYLDDHDTERSAVRQFAVPANFPPRTLSEAVFFRYVQSSTEPVDVLRKLNQHAEWAGVLDPMASAARYVVEATPDDKLRERAREIAMKLSRTAYPRKETDYVKSLEQDLRWWETQRAAAAADPGEVCAGRRLDYILYEEAYIHYLLERYAQAARVFRASVEAGFRAIDLALNKTTRTKESTERAQFALSNIWVAGLLEHCAAFRGHLLDALNGVTSVSVKRLTGLAERVVAIYQALEKASRTGTDGWVTGEPFLNAARETLCPEHTYPTYDLTIDLSEKRFADFLRRHQLNAWQHSLDISSWSWLFLPSVSARGPVPGVPEPNLDTLRTLAPLSDRDSRIGYRFRQTELLYRAAAGQSLVASDALHVAAMLRAAGSFEYLGDHLLLAWRTSNSLDERHAIAWFLTERVPDAGFNELPKLALGQFERTPDA